MSEPALDTLDEWPWPRSVTLDMGEARDVTLPVRPWVAASQGARVEVLGSERDHVTGRAADR